MQLSTEAAAIITIGAIIGLFVIAIVTRIIYDFHQDRYTRASNEAHREIASIVHLTPGMPETVKTLMTKGFLTPHEVTMLKKWHDAHSKELCERIAANDLMKVIK